MNGKIFGKYIIELKGINEKVMKAYEEKNVSLLVDLYGSIKYFNGALMSESLDGFNEEINKLYEYTLVFSRKVYSLILDIL